MNPEPRASPTLTRGHRVALALLLATAVTLATLAACDGRGQEEAESAAVSATDETLRTVRVALVEEGELRATRRAGVTIRAARESRVAAGASGRVAELAAREGTRVAAGDALVRLDDAAQRRALDNARLTRDGARIDLERAQRGAESNVLQAEAAARAAEANLAVAARALEEAEALLAVGGVAASEVERLRASRDGAESSALQGRDAVERSRRAEQEELALLDLQLRQAEVQVRQAQEALDETVVRSPFDGEVAELFTEVGEFVAAGSPVARVLGSGPQLASFDVPPEDAPLVEAAGSVVVSYGPHDVRATVERVERQAQQARLATVTAALEPGAPFVPSGGVAEVRYDLVLGEGLVVPSGALSADAGRTYVFVVVDGDAGAVARRVEVRVAVETGNQAIVTGAVEGGLRAGDRLVTPRPLDVRDGTRVRVVDVAGPPAAP